jgi:hypothetical protein
MAHSEAKRLWKRKEIVRARRDGKPRAPTAIRSCREVAEIMTARGDKISRARVEQIEFRALAKLRKALGELACDFTPGVHDASYATEQQVAAARRRLLSKLEMMEEASACG